MTLSRPLEARWTTGLVEVEPERRCVRIAAICSACGSFSYPAKNAQLQTNRKVGVRLTRRLGTDPHEERLERAIAPGTEAQAATTRKIRDHPLVDVCVRLFERDRKVRNI